MFTLKENTKILRLPTEIVLELFETCVLPGLLYGAEIWGGENLNDIEIFHQNILRNLLKTFKFIPNCLLYGETGSFSMSTKINSKMINFWLNLKFAKPWKNTLHSVWVDSQIAYRKAWYFSFQVGGNCEIHLRQHRLLHNLGE